MATAKYTVRKGDTLSEIASKYLNEYGKPNGYSSLKTYMNYLAEINNISNKDLIYVGQELNLTGTAKSSSTSSTSTKVTIQHFGLQAKSDNLLFVTWKFSKANTESYQVKWQYKAGSVWFIGSDSTVTEKQSTYSYPANAEKVKVQVKPIAKKYTKNNKEYSHYIGQWSTVKTYDVGASVPLPPPAIPTVELGKYKKAEDFKANKKGTIYSSTTTVIAYKLTASISDYDLGSAKTASGEKVRARFELYKVDSSGNKKVDTEYSNIGKKGGLSSGLDVGEARVTFKDLDEGADYYVVCRVEFYKSSKATRYSDWTKHSETIRTTGETPKSLVCTDIKTTDTNKFDVYLKWEGLEDVTYDVEYTTNPDYFDSGANTQSTTGIELPNCVIVGLDGGNTYFFRVRSVNVSGESGWSSPIYLTLGEKPTAPTTWSLTNTIILGEDSTLYWMHNSIDGTDQKYAEIELTIDGVKREKNIVITHLKEDQLIEAYKTGGVLRDTVELIMVDSEDPVNYYVLKTVENDQELYRDGASVNWRVRTAGILTESDDDGNVIPVYSDFSITRTVEIRVEPKLAMNIANADSIDIEEIKAFPFFVVANVTAGKSNQTPIMYYLSVRANEAYETVDGAGNSKTIREGESIYSKHFDPSRPEFYNPDWNPYELRAVISAENIDLENGISYTVNCTVTMDSGLTGSSEADIVVAWDEVYYEPDAEVVIDNDIYAAHIRPYCGKIPYYRVDYSSGYYIKTEEIIAPRDGDAVMSYSLLDFVELGVDDMNAFEITALDGIVYTANIDGYGIHIVINAQQNPHITEDMDKLVSIKIPSGYYSFKYHGPNESISIDDGVNKLYCDTISPSLTTHVDFIEEYIHINKTGTTNISSIRRGLSVSSKTMTTTTGEIVYQAEDGTYFTMGDDLILDDDVLLSVYRRDFDGSFTEIATDIENENLSYVTDPHPALNYARYRIVAKSKTTGSVSYTDISDIPIGGNAIVIQWNENWAEYEMDNYNESDSPAWSGSMVILPYNVDVSDNYNMDVSLVNYIGRKRPVSYYGTHLDEKSTWNTVIPSTDHETLSALRRLAIYTGDVYVREPSGSGYWANVKVSFSQTHCEVTIPVTFDITRVEGGV